MSTSTDAASLPPSSSPSESSPSSSLPSSTHAATPASLFVNLHITPVPRPIILSGSTFKPCPIPTSESPFVFSSSITTSSASESSFVFLSSITTSSTSIASATTSSKTTAVGESTTTVATSSNGQITKVYSMTITVASTTTMPGTVVTGSPIPALTGSIRINMGAIVGGAVGGAGGLIIFALLVFFCLRKRRKDRFDGNFDRAHVTYVKGGGRGTLPKIDLGEDCLIGDNEDDGLGGRLGFGPGGGGIITPYPLQLAPPGGNAVGGQQHRNQPQMQQMSNIGVAAAGAGTASAAGYPNGKRAKRLGQQYAHHTPNQSISSGSFYPFSSYPNLHLNPNSIFLEPYSATSDGFPSLGGSGTYHQPMERGPSSGPSVLSPSSGRRNTNEMKAMGWVIPNPDDGRGQLPAFQQAYLRARHQLRLRLSSSPSTTVPSQPPTPSRAGTAVVVHEDGSWVVLSKGEEAEGKGEVLDPEIPPTYDSLPVDV